MSSKSSLIILKLKFLAKEKEIIRKKLVVTAEKLSLKAKQLAIIAKENESVRRKLAIITKEKENASIAARNVMEDLNIEKAKVEIARAKEQAILHSIGEGQVATDEKGNITVINKVAEEMLGIRSEEVIGKLYSDVIILEDEKGMSIDSDKRPLGVVLASGNTTTSTKDYYVRKDKTKFPVAIIATPIMFEDKIIGAIEVFRDVTKEKEIDKAKTEFVSLASHQLRTPLTTINWYSEMLLQNDIGDDLLKRKEYLEKIHMASERMVVLVNTLLNVSRIELGTLTIEFNSVQVTDLLEDVINEQKLQIDRKNIIVTKHFSENLPTFETDLNLLRMVFQNLLSNAVKYTSAKGHIDISATLGEKNSLLITFADTGYGIPQKDHDKIFTKMFRADNIKEKGENGTGLGLYIVKSVLRSLGGTIRFTSEENKGTTFYVILPFDIGKDK